MNGIQRNFVSLHLAMQNETKTFWEEESCRAVVKKIITKNLIVPQTFSVGLTPRETLL